MKNLLLTRRGAFLAFALLVASMAAVDPVFAQVLEPVNRVSNIVRDTIVGVCLALLTAAWGVAGFKIAFAGANMRDMTGPLIGGAICGSAAALAAVFIT